MPKETVHWGEQYTVVSHPETETTPAWDEEIPFKGVPIDSPVPKVYRSPNLEVYWSRPEDLSSIAYDEDPRGAVQVALEVSRPELDKIRSEAYSGPDVNSYTIYTRAMSRHQINKLIKTLKRARDTALGADE